LPWYANGIEAAAATNVKPGASSEWVGIRLQDTAHTSFVSFGGSGQLFDVALRPVGGAVERQLSGKDFHDCCVYLPPYPGKGDKPVRPVEALDAVLKQLAAAPPVGKVPTRPLCYGGWLTVGTNN